MEDGSYNLNVSAIMTAPRHEIVLARTYIDMALKQAGIPIAISGGVFYGQCMQRMMQDALNGGVDVLFTVDFDSLFTARDIHRLLSKLISNEHIDALAAMQCRRGMKFPLMTVTGVTEQQIEVTTPFEVDTAHFGLTAINMRKLRDVEKPWFFSKPNEAGDWDDGKIDDDIWFWQQWKKAGNTIFIDPETNIGHMEEMAVIMNEKMEPVHIYPKQWADRAYGEPQPKGTLVFVGTNHPSDQIKKLVAKHEQSYLFEPLPDVAEEIRKAFHDKANVTVIESAASNQHGKQKLYRYNARGESSSLGIVTKQAKELYGHVDWTVHEEIDVHTCNLFDWWDLCEIGPIETLVIDAQGMDLTILKTMKPLLETGQIRYIQAEAEGQGFKHYDGLPDNSERGFLEFMEQFPWYVPSRVKESLAFQPDLTWGFNPSAFAERKQLCEAALGN